MEKNHKPVEVTVAKITVCGTIACALISGVMGYMNNQASHQEPPAKATDAIRPDTAVVDTLRKVYSVTRNARLQK